MREMSLLNSIGTYMEGVLRDCIIRSIFPEFRGLVRSCSAMEYNSDEDFVKPREVKRRKRKRRKVTVKVTEESGAGLSSDSECDAHVKVLLRVYYVM